jgi:hypothetical protein
MPLVRSYLSSPSTVSFYSIFCAGSLITLHASLFHACIFPVSPFLKSIFLLLSCLLCSIYVSQNLSRPVSLLPVFLFHCIFISRYLSLVAPGIGLVLLRGVELDLQSLFGLHVMSCEQLYSVAETPQPPSSPPRIWTRIRGRYWSAKIDDISL